MKKTLKLITSLFIDTTEWSHVSKQIFDDYIVFFRDTLTVIEWSRNTEWYRVLNSTIAFKFNGVYYLPPEPILRRRSDREFS